MRTKKDLYPIFIKACKNGDEKSIEKILYSGLDLNEEIEKDTTLITKGLSIAIENKQSNILSLFLSRKIATFKISPTILIKAVKYREVKLAEELIKEYKFTKFMSEKYRESYIREDTTVLDSSLCWAMENRYDEIVDMLTEILDIENDIYYASFISACRNNYIDVIKLILKSEIDLSKTHSEDALHEVSIIDSALYWAIERENKEIVDYILSLENFDKQKFYASFIAACKKGYIEVAKNIIEDELDVNKMHKEFELNETSIMDSAIYWAIENNNKDILDYLISLKFDASKCDNTFIRAYIDKLDKVIFALLLNGFNRREWLEQYNFLVYSDSIEIPKNKDFFIINIEMLTSKEEKELKYFLLENIKYKDKILLISKKEIKNHILRLGTKYIEKFDINKDYNKIKEFLENIKQ